ncbi:TPA: oligopeptide/dipeptide ABC transporter ATP-binding protein [Klebsiella pneumoniae]
MTTPLVSFNHLSVSFAGERSRVRAVQEVSFTIQAGQTVGVVGESGCGKSVTAMALMGLLPPQTARIDGGEIRFADRDLLRLKARQMAMMLITHDLGVIAQMAEQVVVMYAGRIVEQGATAEVLRHPQHPYTRGLIASRPVPGERRRRLYSIPGQVPDLAALPAGCAFAGRCERATARCREAIPQLLGDRQRAACFYSEFAEVTA